MRVCFLNKRYFKIKGSKKNEFRNMIIASLFLILFGITGLNFAYSSDELFEGNMMNSDLTNEIKEQHEKILEVKFVNLTNDEINSRYSNANIKGDLTYECTGSVKAWLEPHYESNEDYVLYIAGVGKIYINTCERLFQEFNRLRKIDFQNLDTSLSNNMSYMFYKCISLEELNLTSLNTSNVRDMTWMFADCENLINLNISNLNTSKVNNMWYMFANCRNLIDLDISSFDTSNVTDMSSMFSGCYSLSSLDVSHFNTSKVVDMGEMFAYCEKLPLLNLRNFDTSNVINMHGMFKRCSRILYIKLDGENWNTSKVEEMYDMFRECSRLIALDLSHFDTTNVTDMSYMFAGCGELVFLDITDFRIPSRKEELLGGCGKLGDIDMDNIKDRYHFPEIDENLEKYSKFIYFDFDVRYMAKILNTKIYDSNGVEKNSAVNLVTGDYYMIDSNKKYIHIPGDVDADGSLTIADIMRISSHIYKGNGLIDSYKKAIDYDNDSKESIADIMSIANTIYRGGY